MKERKMLEVGQTFIFRGEGICWDGTVQWCYAEDAQSREAFDKMVSKLKNSIHAFTINPS